MKYSHMLMELLVAVILLLLSWSLVLMGACWLPLLGCSLGLGVWVLMFSLDM